MKNEYIVAIDYSANYKPLTIDYKMLKAENLLDAMNEAEQYMDKETVYLLKRSPADTPSAVRSRYGCRHW